MSNQKTIQRIEELIGKIDAMPDPDAKAVSVELVQSLMDLHGAGIERMMEIAADGGAPGLAIIDGYGRDDLVKGLLLLYDLHPQGLEARVMQALAKVRPYLESHGGNVEVLGIQDNVVRLRLQGSCKSCPSSAMTLKLAIEEAIYEAAPDVRGIEAEGAFEQPAAAELVALGRTPTKQSASHSNGDGHGWKEVSGLESLGHGGVRSVEVAGRSLLFCRLDEALYAYSSECPGCKEKLQAAQLDETSLVCSACGRRYDCRKAGRGIDHADFLKPFPLLVEHGQTKVALPA